MFTILVASDLFGEKVNLEVGFTVRPTLKQVVEMVERCYGIEVGDRKGGRDMTGYIGYKVSRFQVYEEGRAKWVDLVSTSQLSDYCQLYAFQPPNPWHKEVRAPIPAPVKAKLAPTCSALAVPDDPSHDEKVSAIFDDMDLNNDRHIDSDEFHRCCSLANLPFSSATLTDLFTKADLNADKLLSYSEFQRFAELYPSLMDALYHRLKFYWEDMRIQTEIDACREAMQRAQDDERRAKADHNERIKAVAAAEGKLQNQEREVHVKVDKLRRAEDEARDAAREVDRSRKEVALKEQDLALQKEKERIKAQAADDFKTETQKATARVGNSERDISNVESFLRQTEQLHSDHNSGTARELSKTESAAVVLLKAQESQKEAAEQKADAEREVMQVTLAIGELDNAIATQQHEERNAQLRHAAAVEHVARCNGIKQDEQAMLQECRGREQEYNAARMAAERRTEDRAKEVAELERQNNDYVNQMQEQNHSETPILHQEIRLREQRDSLEVKENALRNDQKVFYQNTYQPGHSSIRRK